MLWAMMLANHIRGILFDKDGTLIDFGYTWLPVWRRFASIVASEYGAGPGDMARLSLALGIGRFGFRGDSLFAQGSNGEILAAVETALPGLERASAGRALAEAAAPSHLRARPLGLAKQALDGLRLSGLILGVATADDEAATLATLRSAGLLSSFGFIGTNDAVARGKPHPDLMHLFCAYARLEPSEVAVVGDTERDMVFARASGAGQAILIEGAFATAKALGLCDAVVPDIGALAQPVAAA